MFFAEQALLEQIHTLTGQNAEIIVALDEVGRGCVAGPVLTCASMWVRSHSSHAWITEVKDSKKLSPKKRLSCYKQVLAEFNYTNENLPFKNFHSFPKIDLSKSALCHKFLLPELNKVTKTHHFKCVGFCLGESSVEEVEIFNIWNAVQIALARALLGLKEYFFDKFNTSFDKLALLMDGNKPIAVPAPFLNTIQIVAVKADDLFLSVGLSSILAKVHRDLFMESQESIYPQFGFAKHKGYGTPQHLEKILTQGVCQLHRRSFLTGYMSAK